MLRRLETIIILIVAVVLVTVLARSQATQAQATTRGLENPTIAKMQAERVALLRDAVTAATSLFESGATSYGEIYRRKIILLDAQLEQVQATAQRTELLQSEIDAAKGLEEYEEHLFNQGKAQRFEVNDAKADRLKYSIALARETSG